MPRQVSFDAPDAGRTEAVGEMFAACMKAPLTLWLSGELGGGKTTFSRGFIRALGYHGRVKSPSYTLLEIYEAGGVEVLHFDLYRLSGADEFEMLGARDYLGARSVCLIEWPENAAGALPAPDAALRFLFVGRAGGRRIEAEAGSQAGRDLLDAVEARERAAPNRPEPAADRA